MEIVCEQNRLRTTGKDLTSF